MPGVLREQLCGIGIEPVWDTLGLYIQQVFLQREGKDQDSITMEKM